MMEDGVNNLLLWGDDFEVILEGHEAVEQQFVATANNESLNCANVRFEFLATDGPKPLLVWRVTRVTRIYKTQKFNLKYACTTCND